jgi:hypothetical protein
MNRLVTPSAGNNRLLALAVLMASALALTLTSAQQEAAAGEFDTISTASYPLFPVDGSDVTGQLQVVSRLESGSVLILTVDGIAEGRSYAAAIYAGDCGPDRELVLELEPVGRANDPYVSITETELTFAFLTEGDHFVYVFDGEGIDGPDTPGLDTPALACGEVGLGALE